jgi:hypothetical protein
VQAAVRPEADSANAQERAFAELASGLELVIVMEAAFAALRPV